MSSQQTNLRKASRNPSSIANDQNNDASGVSRSTNGEIIAVESFVADSSLAAGVDVPERGSLRVCNTSGSIQFLWVGDHDQVPGAAPTIANGLALPSNHVAMLFTGVPSSDQKSLKIKSSSAQVQVVICKP
jgi:hypothetical protein